MVANCQIGVDDFTPFVLRFGQQPNMLNRNCEQQNRQARQYFVIKSRSLNTTEICKYLEKWFLDGILIFTSWIGMKLVQLVKWRRGKCLFF